MGVAMLAIVTKLFDTIFPPFDPNACPECGGKLREVSMIPDDNFPSSMALRCEQCREVLEISPPHMFTE
jgi:uncharacterized protein with PIN domain